MGGAACAYCWSFMEYLKSLLVIGYVVRNESPCPECGAVVNLTGEEDGAS
jgi:hypothetical protein